MRVFVSDPPDDRRFRRALCEALSTNRHNIADLDDAEYALIIDSADDSPPSAPADHPSVAARTLSASAARASAGRKAAWAAFSAMARRSAKVQPRAVRAW